MEDPWGGDNMVFREKEGGPIIANRVEKVNHRT